MKLRLSAILITLTFFIYCKNKNEVKTTGNIISQDRMAEVITDLHIVEAGITPLGLMGDSALQYVVDNYSYVYKKYNITDQEFKESLRYYAAHPRQLDKIYEKVIENLNKMQIETQN